jgi:hypothetical protein
MAIHAERGFMMVLPALVIGQFLIGAQGPLSPQGAPTPPKEDALMRVLRASDWKGAVQFSDEGCTASTGEYTLWVYAAGTRCGVPRDQADRVVIIRQPLPGVSAITAAAQLPAGTYAVWAYGAGDPGYPWLRLCGRTCVRGELPTTPAWVSLGSIDVRDNQLLLLKSWQQPVNHRLYVQVIVLSSGTTPPDWTP